LTILLNLVFRNILKTRTEIKVEHWKTQQASDYTITQCFSYLHQNKRNFAVNKLGE